MSQRCINCQELLQGTYCHQCGEKVVEPKDFHLKTLLSQTVDGFFNLDSKFLKSFKNLLFKPGKLTTHYVHGLRNPYMKPIQLFLICNLLFFFLLTNADILRIPSRLYFVKDSKQAALMEAVQASGTSEEILRANYDALSTNLSKAAVIVLIPMFALVFAFVNFTKRKPFGMHVIFSLHYFSFFLLFCLIALMVLHLDGPYFSGTTIVINLLYLTLAIKEFYRDKWPIALVKGLITVILCFVLTLTYRSLISEVSFKWMI